MGGEEVEARGLEPGSYNHVSQERWEGCLVQAADMARLL